MKLPLKLRIFQFMAEQDRPLKDECIYDQMKLEYPDEMQTRDNKRIDFYLNSLLCVNMIEQTEVEYEEDGRLAVTYQITDFGKSRIKYIPKR